MEITINLPEWIAHIGVILIALWAADKTLLLIKNWYEWKIRKLKNKQETKQCNIADVSISIARAEKYAKMQHFLGETGRDFVK